MASKSNWLDNVKLYICGDVYIYQGDMICKDDAAAPAARARTR